MATAYNDCTGDKLITRGMNANFLANRDKVDFTKDESKENLPMWIHKCSVRRVRISTKGGEQCEFCDCGDEVAEAPEIV